MKTIDEDVITKAPLSIFAFTCGEVIIESLKTVDTN